MLAARGADARGGAIRALVLAALLALGGAAPAGARDVPAGPHTPGTDPAGDDPPATHLASLDPPDPYFPELGNAGLDVMHYDLALRTNPAVGRLDGTAVLTVRAERDLELFFLDLAGLTVGSVQVDVRPARFVHRDAELRVEPSQPLAAGDQFEVRVRYRGVPGDSKQPGTGFSSGWYDLGGSSVTLNEPDGARRWFPGNDHPSDKATYTFRITAPERYVGVANGTLAAERDAAGMTTWVWEEDAPMSTYLAQVAVGDFELTQEPGPAGVEIRDAVAVPVADQVATSPIVDTPEMLEFFAERFGAYPFDVYGVLVPDADLGAAFESQTLTLINADLPATVYAHELAHQWFGNWVTPAAWDDIWLNEGFATFGEWLWAEHAEGVPLDRSARAAARTLRRAPTARVDDPGVEYMFSALSYQRGALTLRALQLDVGDEIFYRILRTYLDRYGGGVATTEDFVNVATEVAGRDLGPLFEAWFAAEPAPDLPGSEVLSVTRP